jgi:hypothetical protein
LEVRGSCADELVAPHIISLGMRFALSHPELTSPSHSTRSSPLRKISPDPDFSVCPPRSCRAWRLDSISVETRTRRSASPKPPATRGTLAVEILIMRLSVPPRSSPSSASGWCHTWKYKRQIQRVELGLSFSRVGQGGREARSTRTAHAGSQLV